MKSPFQTQRTTEKLHSLSLVEQPDLVKWANAFLLAKKAEGVAIRTHSFYREKLERFVTFALQRNVQTVEDITANLIREFMLYLEETKHKPGGIHCFYRVLRVMLRWYENEVEPETWRNPITKVKPPKVPEETLEPVELVDVEAMVQTCKTGRMDMRDKAVLLALLDTGCRATEFTKIDVADVDLATGSIIVRQGKGRKPRTVFVGQKTRKAIRAYLRLRGSAEGPLFQTRMRTRLDYDGLREIVRQRAIAAGIERPPLHSFRRAFALNMLRNGCDLLTLQRLMGHADLSLLRRYAKQTVEDLRAVHGAASPVDRLMD